MGQLHDLVEQEGLTCRLHDIFVCGIRIAIEDVLLDGALEDMVLLQDESDMFAQPLRVPLRERCAVQGDAAAVGLIELVQQVHDGTLTGSAQSHQGCYPSGWDA